MVVARHIERQGIQIMQPANHTETQNAEIYIIFFFFRFLYFFAKMLPLLAHRTFCYIHEPDEPFFVYDTVLQRTASFVFATWSGQFFCNRIIFKKKRKTTQGA
jgi:hypothetical protein